MIGCLRSGKALPKRWKVRGDMATTGEYGGGLIINNYRCGMTLTQSLKRALGKLAEHSFFRQFINTVELLPWRTYVTLTFYHLSMNIV